MTNTTAQYVGEVVRKAYEQIRGRMTSDFPHAWEGLPAHYQWMLTQIAVHSAESLSRQRAVLSEWDAIEVMKVALTVLCAARVGQSWHENMLKDFDAAIFGLRTILGQPRALLQQPSAGAASGEPWAGWHENDRATNKDDCTNTPPKPDGLTRDEMITASARRAGIEEAAKVADRYVTPTSAYDLAWMAAASNKAKEIANAIRALASNDSTEKE